ALLVEQVLALRKGTLAVLRLFDRLALRDDDLLAVEIPFEIVVRVRLGVTTRHHAVVSLRRGFQSVVIARDGVLAAQGGFGKEHHTGLAGPADVTDRLAVLRREVDTSA